MVAAGAADYKKREAAGAAVVQKGCIPQGKRLTMICASLALLQIMFAVHPLRSGGGEKGSYVQKAIKKELPKEFSFFHSH